MTRPEDLQRLLDACDGAPAIYFALPPAVTAKACAALGQLSLPAGTALVLEKPFGVDQSSAADLNTIIGRLVPEDQIHRVDHFLGKSTVLNLLGLRFTNRLFEPLWSADHIERVDIVFDEPLGLENRARYYDGAGALVDMIQSHLLQVLALIAMDPPASLYARDLRDRKAEALRACRVWAGDPVAASRRARYTAGTIDGRQLPGYAEEPGVDPARQTETLAEVVLEVDTWRWAGVPFRLRSGKALAKGRKEIVITFKPVPRLLPGLTGEAAADQVTDLDGTGPVGAGPEHQRAGRPVRDRSGHAGRGLQSRPVARLRGGPGRCIRVRSHAVRPRGHRRGVLADRRPGTAGLAGKHGATGGLPGRIRRPVNLDRVGTRTKTGFQGSAGQPSTRKIAPMTCRATWNTPQAGSRGSGPKQVTCRRRAH